MRCCAGHTMRVRDLVAIVAVTGATLGAVGCGSSGSTAPQTGSLAVAIAAPAGVTPSVTVNGPGGYTKALSATATLTGLAVGSYAVTAAPVATTAPIVATVNTATVVGSPATVAANGTAAVTATYAVRPGSGGLWVANFSNPRTVVEYTAGQLGSTTSAAPAIAIGAGVFSWGVAFDGDGDLWVTLVGINTVVEYTASQLGASGTPTPAVTLTATAGSLNQPAELAFDANGNLWVANPGNSSVAEFTVSQLASSGSPTPAVTLSASSGSLNVPIGLAFDPAGNLWVANANDSSVVEFIVSQLGASGSPTPAVTLSASSGSLSTPYSLAFDASGDLWVTNAGFHTGYNTVVEFAPSQLAVTGSPTPAVTLSATAGSLNWPAGLAFDASGNLWVSNEVGPVSVVAFTPSQLNTTGSPTPSTTVSNNTVVGPLGLAFDPHAANLPLKP